MWLSTFILTPIAVYLTYKATNDSTLLDTDWYAGRVKAIEERLAPYLAPIKARINKLAETIKSKRK